VGEWWAADREGVSPDILLTAKGLSGGVVPVGAAVCTPAAFDRLGRDPLLHTTTFGGAPIAMAAASAAIAAIEEEQVVERAALLGERLLAETRLALAEHGDVVADIRGVGLLIGIEFRADHLAGDFAAELLRRRVIVSYSLGTNRVVRLTPPVSLDDDQIDWLATAMDASASAIAERYGVR
jgi:putrescine aminotransferase